MANLINIIFADVAGLQKCSLHPTLELEKSRNKNKMIKRNNEAFKLLNKQLTTQLDDKSKLLITKDDKAHQLIHELLTCKAERLHVKR